jgi:hypothetical protein
MGRIKPKTVAELMDVANRFVDGEDAYQNKRTLSPEDNRSTGRATRGYNPATMTTMAPIAK